MSQRLKYAMYLAVAGIVLFLFVTLIPAPPLVAVQGADGACDVSTLAFDQEVAKISGGWHSYLNALYTPADFAAGAVTQTPVLFDDAHAASVPYGTHRLVLTVPAGQPLALAFRSLDYATVVYIDGRLMGEVGHVADSKEKTIPKTDNLVYYFTPQHDTLEIVLQYANFHHVDGGRTPDLTLGSAGAINRIDRKSRFSQALVMGILLMAFLYHLAMFLVQGRRRDTLYFAMACLLFALRSPLIASLLWPNAAWISAIRWEYIDVFSASLFLALFFPAAFPQWINRKVMHLAAASLAVYDVLILFTQPIFFSRLALPYQFVCGLSVLYVTVRLGVSLKARKTQNLLAFMGTVLFLAATVAETLGLNNMLLSGSENLLPVGTVMLVLAYMIVLTLNFEEQQQTAQAAQLTMEHQLSLQAQSFEQLARQMDETRRARHDHRHHVSVIASLAEKADHAALTRYLQEYQATQPDEHEDLLCRNHAVDAVVRHYLGKAEKAGTKVDVQLMLPLDAGVSDADLTVVFGNVFENCLNAILRQQAGEKFIHARCQCQDGRIVLTVDNSCDPGTAVTPGTGQRSIQAVALRHGGTARFRQENGVYQTSVLLLTNTDFAGSMQISPDHLTKM